MAGNYTLKLTGCLGLSIFLGATLFHCKKEEGPEFVDMIFMIPISIQFSGSDMKVGDTLWLKGSVPDTFQEYYSKKYFVLRDFDFKSKLCLSKLINPSLTISEQPGAIVDFQIVNQTGSFSELLSVCGDFNFSYSQNHYHYKIGLVAKNPGIYNLSLLWPISGRPIELAKVISLGLNASGQERIPNYEAFYFTINDGNNNFYLFKSNCKAVSVDLPTDANIYFEQKGAFTFEVK